MEVGVEVDDGGHVALLERHKRSQAFPGSGPGGWMESCDQLCFCLSQAERARQTASQPPCPDSGEPPQLEMDRVQREPCLAFVLEASMQVVCFPASPCLDSK
jgi:hypothetical protein